MTSDVAAQDDVAPGACGDVDPERADSAKFDALVDMLRHADTSTTRIYAKVVNKMQENPAKFLEAMLTAQASV